MRIEVRRVRPDEGSVARTVASDFKSAIDLSGWTARPANSLCTKWMSPPSFGGVGSVPR